MKSRRGERRRGVEGEGEEKGGSRGKERRRRGVEGRSGGVEGREGGE